MIVHIFLDAKAARSAEHGYISGMPKHSLKVAVIESDATLRDKVLLPGLREYGFEVEGYAGSRELYFSMLTRTFDVVLLDVILPGENGLVIAARLREVMPEIGIVMFTSSTDPQQQLRAMNDGVDIFLSKPLDVEVIAATFRSLARRMQRATEKSKKEEIAINPQPGQSTTWQLASDGWCLLSPTGQNMTLTVPERSIMVLLDANRGQPVERKRLIAALTVNVVDFDPHRLESLVHRIRRKALATAPTASPLPLLAVRGKGYVLAT